MPPDDAPAAVERLARDASTIVTPPLPITCAVPASTRSAVSSSIPIPRQSGRRLTAPRSRVIDRAFEHAQLGGTQCAGLAGGSDRLPRSRGAVRARAREKMGPGGERGKRGMLVLGLGPAAANASGWARLPGLTWIMAIVAGGSATARAEARWGSRR